jgi:hypothetical protein
VKNIINGGVRESIFEESWAACFHCLHNHVCVAKAGIVMETLVVFLVLHRSGRRERKPLLDGISNDEMRVRAEPQFELNVCCSMLIPNGDDIFSASNRHHHTANFILVFKLSDINT